MKKSVKRLRFDESCLFTSRTLDRQPIGRWKHAEIRAISLRYSVSPVTKFAC